MQFEYSEKSQELIDKVDRFMRDNLYPVEPVSYTHLTLPTILRV